jgi:uncharacterized protein YqgC (DUF456 family)
MKCRNCELHGVTGEAFQADAVLETSMVKASSAAKWKLWSMTVGLVLAVFMVSHDRTSEVRKT